MQKKPEILKNYGKTYEVEWVRFAGSGDAMPALVAGKLDGCLATPFPMANAINQSHVPVTIVHQLLSFGFDGYYDDSTVVRTDSGINDVRRSERQDLRRQRDRRHASTWVSGSWRARAGLNAEKDLTIIEARPPFLAGMVRDNKIQAATLFQPFYEEAMAKGDLKVLFTSSDIYGGPTDYVFMAFDDKFLKANPQAVRDYVEDYLRAVNWALDNRAEAVRIYAEEWKLPVPVVDSYLLTKKDYLCGATAGCRQQDHPADRRCLAANGFITKFDVSKYLDLSYLPK